MRPLIVIRRTPKIDFMAWHKLGFALSLLLTLSSIGLFLTIGLNYGIDFIGGTLIEVRSTTGPADLGDMRQKLDALHIGEPSLQGFGPPSDVLIRLPRQPGGDAEQERAVQQVRQALGQGFDYRRVEVVGPSVGSELIRAGVIATVLALLAIPLRMAVRRRRDGLDLARRDYHGRAVRTVPARIQPDDLGGDPDDRRLLGQRHGRDL